MTAQEFVERYKGREVRLIDQSSFWELWRGIVIGVDGSRVAIQTKVQVSSGGAATTCYWQVKSLEIIEEINDLVIPENKHPCPKCQSLDCKGLARLDCIVRDMI